MAYMLDWGGLEYSRILPHLCEEDVLVIHRSSSLENLQFEDTLELSREVRECGGPHMIYCCSTAKETQRLQGGGVDAILCPNNAFMDHALFNITGERKVFDAVHNARLIPVKRHDLMRYALNRGKSVALLSHQEDVSYSSSLGSMVAKYRIISRNSFADHGVIARILNMSKVGLILSDLEGGCFASTEYLLCGIPVVSTRPMNEHRTLGGREYWYDEYNSILVDPNPMEIDKAIDELLSRSVDSAFIRKSALSKSRVFQYALINKVRKISGLEGYSPLYLSDRGLWKVVSWGVLQEALESGRDLNLPSIVHLYNESKIPEIA